MLINNVCVCSWWIWCISQIVLFMLFRRGPRGAISSPQTASVWSWEPHLRLHLQSRSCCLCQADAAAAFTCDGEGEKKISGFQPQTALFYPLCRAPFVILLSGPIPRICQPIPDSRNPQTHTHSQWTDTRSGHWICFGFWFFDFRLHVWMARTRRTRSRSRSIARIGIGIKIRSWPKGPRKRVPT